ncbi:MAG: hypothetical protein LC647_03065, partial [Beggiatoa sp.]|nr:hypothetical protein [Beggiatoa sp.]
SSNPDTETLAPLSSLGHRAELVQRTDPPQIYKDLASGPFFGFNRPGAKVSQSVIDSFWLHGMQSGRKIAPKEGHCRRDSSLI